MTALDFEQIVGAFHDCSSRQIPKRIAAAVAEAGEQLADLAAAEPLTPEQIREATTGLRVTGNPLAAAIAQHDHLPTGDNR